MLQAWMSYGYIVLLAIGVLAYVLWRRGGAVLAIAFSPSDGNTRVPHGRPAS